jgi:hypothetical protein
MAKYLTNHLSSAEMVAIITNDKISNKQRNRIEGHLAICKNCDDLIVSLREVESIPSIGVSPIAREKQDQFLKKLSQNIPGFESVKSVPNFIPEESINQSNSIVNKLDNIIKEQLPSYKGFTPGIAAIGNDLLKELEFAKIAISKDDMQNRLVIMENEYRLFKVISQIHKITNRPIKWKIVREREKCSNDEQKHIEITVDIPFSTNPETWLESLGRIFDHPLNYRPSMFMCISLYDSAIRELKQSTKDFKGDLSHSGNNITASEDSYLLCYGLFDSNSKE